MREVYLEWNGTRTKLDESKLILFTDTSLSIDPLTWLPISRLSWLAYPISNIIGGMESRNKIINSRGALGVLSPNGTDSAGQLPMTPKEKAEMQAEWRRHGLLKSQSDIIVTNTNVKWEAIGIKPSELMLLEYHAADVEELCNGLNYPKELLGEGTSTKYANKDEAKKLLYQDAIIPEAEALMQQLATGLKLHDFNIELSIDYGHIEALQSSLKEKADARLAMNQAYLVAWEAGLATLDEWAMAVGDEPKAVEPFMFNKPQYDKWLQDNGFAPQLPISTRPNTDLTNLENENSGKNNDGKTA